ncbi:MAG: hypothetical protein JW726_19845 [Anaerolineales bacterium]|nr:hypothetical protein [Anaerolineales bacterium]
MNVQQAIEIAAQAIEREIPTWPGYSPRGIPLAIFDAEQVAYLNHPNPPTERPQQLLAATAVEINNHLTATIPLWVCSEPESVGPLVYHECFHVYQDQGGFQPIPIEEGFNFYRVLADYPELDPLYRALCRAEAEVHNNERLSAEQKATHLAALASRRYAILENLPGAMTLEQSSERREASAFFIQQAVAHALHDIPLPAVPFAAGYSRQYATGAAVCRLLSQSGGDWHAAIEAGQAPTQALISRFMGKPDLDDLQLSKKVNEEHAAITAILDTIESEFSQDVMRIQIPEEVDFRGFNPMTILSVGNGRLLHRDVYFLQLPNGRLDLKSGKVLEDYRTNEILLQHPGLEFSAGMLAAHTETIECELNYVEQVATDTYRILPLPYG